MENSFLESVGTHKGQLCKVGLVTFTFSLIQASLMGLLVCDKWWQMVSFLTLKAPGLRKEERLAQGVVVHEVSLLRISSSKEVAGRVAVIDQPAHPTGNEWSL